MLEDFKFAWDWLFLFMLFVSTAFIVLDFVFHLSPTMLHTIECIDFTILAGYYGFFFIGFRQAKEKLSYCKSHVWLIILLVIPFVPFARAIRLQFFEKYLKLGSNVVWHVLDRIGML